MNIIDALDMLRDAGYNIEGFEDPLNDRAFLDWTEQEKIIFDKNDDEYVYKLYQEFKKLKRIKKDFE